MSRKTTLSPGEDGLIDPALTLPNALPSLSDYERAEPVLAALQGQIKTLRAAHAIELFARAFVDFPWVDGFDIETFNDSVSATPFAWLPDGSTAAIDQIAVAFERVAAEKTRSGPNPAAPSTPERDVYSDDIDDLLNALAKLMEGDEGFTPNIGSSPPERPPAPFEPKPAAP